MTEKNTRALKQFLKPVHIWAMAIGLVISGQYFGWSYGWAIAGTVGFLVSTAIVALMYITLVLGFAELTAAIPNAGGPFAFALKAFGPWGGLLSGFATIVEFVFIPPAIAFGLGSYLHFLNPMIPVVSSSIVVFSVFILLNLTDIKYVIRFEVVITFLAICELFVFMALVGPHFQMDYFLKDASFFGWKGVFMALPFAIWFFLAIEGVSMAVEEVENPERDIPKAYLWSILTIVFLSFLIMIITGGAENWHQIVRNDYPLPEAMASALGRESQWVKVLLGIGIFGLVASLNGVIFVCSRQIFAVSRAGFLPKFLSSINSRFHTPHWAILAGGVIGVICLLSGKTDELIIIAVLGGVVMHITTMASLFILRIKEPNLSRPFRTPFYPIFPLLAIVLSSVCLVSIVISNVKESIVFLAMFTVVFFAYLGHIFLKKR